MENVSRCMRERLSSLSTVFPPLLLYVRCIEVNETFQPLDCILSSSSGSLFRDLHSTFYLRSRSVVRAADVLGLVTPFRDVSSSSCRAGAFAQRGAITEDLMEIILRMSGRALD